MEHYISFLYLIASVFAPMAAVLLVSFYLTDHSKVGKAFWIGNLFAWLVGFAVYQYAAHLESVFLGPSLLSVVVSFVISYLFSKTLTLKPKGN